ncbi:TonB-dependent receptor [Rhizorhabdus argentea]|uniref:TonB-dependent receptor n=1 Tax=Rhizorhabdus argentea TaxID=1387174 RepID=UPI0030ECF07C
MALSALLASASYAQSPATTAGTVAAPSDAADQTGEIIVTAQRRSENLQDTPIAVTAVTAVAVQNLGLADIKDIAAITPGASFTTTNGFFTSRIRGIGTDFVSVGLESPVAIYEDGAYLTRTLTVNEILDNFDIGSIQVLRGPQGTLYGRNATGGVIIINSADPTSGFKARVRGEVGNQDRYQLNGMINLPLGEDLAFRGTASYKHEGGFVRNIITGGKVGGGRTYSARGKLRWQPGNADIVLGGQYYDTAYRLGPLQSLDRNDSTCLVCVLNPGSVRPVGLFETQSVVSLQPVRTKYYGANLRMSFDAGDFQLTSTTTYRRQKTVDSSGDADLTPLPGFEFAVPRSGGRSYTQDFQVSSKLEGAFNFLFGLSYLNDKGIFNTRFIGDPALGVGGTGLTVDTSFGADNTARTKSYAAFLEGYYQITDQLKATVGGRYTYEEREAHAVSFGFPFDLRTSQRAFTPRFVLAWDNGPTNVYYSFTRGFKAGGFPGPIFAPINPVQPEKIFSHEVGVKQSLFDHRLRLNAAAFYFKNKGLQVQTVDLGSGGTKTENAGALENYGIEVEAQVVPMGGLNIGLSGSWQHARYRPFKGAASVCFDPNTVPTLSRCFLDLTGTPPPLAPDWSGSLNATYEFAIASWTASLSGLAQYRSSVYYQPGAGGELMADRDGSRVLVNASGYVSPPGENLRLGFYANNVFNKKYRAFIQTDTTFGVYHNAARARTYGLRVEYAF